jgi:hypothetical protein
MPYDSFIATYRRLKMTSTKRITLATVKAFIRKNAGKLLIEQTSDFDGMTDCVQRCEGGYSPVLKSDMVCDNNMGIQGAWFVFGSRDYFSEVKKDGLFGYEVCNCCGSFSLAVAA